MNDNIGPVDDLALTEIVPSELPIAVNVARPTADRKSLILFTTGMSQQSMNVPAGGEDYRLAEVFIELPPDWPLDIEALKDENNSWPITWLRKVARYVHETNTFPGNHLVISNEDPPRPLAPNTQLSCMMMLFTGEMGTVEAADGRLVHFYQLLPMYREERDLFLSQGIEAFAELLMKHNIDTMVDVKRVNVATGSGC